MPNRDTKDVYSRVTDKIIASLESGVRPWVKPWGDTGAPAGVSIRPLRSNGVPYRGINVVMLWGEQWAKGYTSSTWLTYKQAAEFGGNVKRGERGSLVVYANRFTKEHLNPVTGENEERSIPYMKGYTVFNVEQCEGLPERFKPASVVPVVVDRPELVRNEKAESFVTATGANIAHGGSQAFFMPSQNRIQMPPVAAFHNVEGYYATLLHELTHWTHGEGRLVREFGRKRWGDEGYAAEELVAELGAAFLCSDLGVCNEPRDDHAAYLSSWLKVLRNDRKAIFTAASYAQAAADYLHSLQPGATGEGDEGAEFDIAA